MTRTSAPQLTLTLSLDEVNLILERLGNLPFNRVFGLIGRLQEQAAPQLQSEPIAEPSAAPLAMVASR